MILFRRFESMKLSILVLLLASFVVAKPHRSSSSLASSSSSSSLSLESRIQRAVDSLFPKARIGLAIRSCRSDSLLRQIGAGDWFTPASTLKVVVTATALDTMPLDWMPVTRLSLDGVMKGRTFIGQLRVIGGGDPNISSRYFPDALTLPRMMADSLKRAGVDTVRGGIVPDLSWFPGPSKPQGWRSYFFDTWYGALVSPLSFNDNVYLLKISPGEKIGDSARVSVFPDVGFVDIQNNLQTGKGARTQIVHLLDSATNKLTLSGVVGVKGSGEAMVLPVRNPAGYYIAALQRALLQRNIAFIPDGKVQPSSSRQVFEFHSAPLLSILDEVNQRSQNLHAETLLRNVGAFRFQDGTTEGGVLAEKLFLRKMGLSAEDFYLVDGCGLSPDNKVKPGQVSLLLSKMTHHPQGVLFASSMAQPGVTGSGAKRLSGLDVAHQVRIKTGFIAGVQGLVGYMGTSSGDSLAVTLFLNGYRGSDSKARDLMDTLWTWIAHNYNAEYETLKEARSLWFEADSLHGYRSRLDYFSKRLMGRPYLLGPTGEGIGATIDPKPRINLSQFDCVTYLEHVMALAKASSADSVFDVLQRIRYQKGHIDFAFRKHYFVEDWIGKSPESVELMRVPGDSLIVRQMDKKAFFAAKNLMWPGENPQTTIPFLPLDRAIEWSKKWSGPDTLIGVGFMSNLPSICVFHTGFLIAKSGEPLRFRHASQLRGEVTEQFLGEYLESKRGKTPGIVLYGFK